MIKAKEIIELLEDSQDYIKDFMEEIHKLKPGLGLEMTNRSKSYTLSLNIPMGIGLLTQENIDKFLTLYKSNYVSATNFEAFFGGSRLIDREGSFQTIFSNYSAVTLASFSIPLARSRIDSFTLLLSFDEKLLIDYYSKHVNQEYEFLSYLPFWVSKFFEYFLLIVNQFKLKLADPENTVKTRKKFIKLVMSSGLPIQIDNPDETVLVFYLVVPIEKREQSTKVRDYFLEFLDEIDRKLILPVKELERVVGPATVGIQYPSYTFQLPKTLLDMGLNLYNTDSTSISSLNLSHERGIVVYFRIFHPKELNFLPENILKELADSIGEMFIGYKKLINQFNNKPTKKTNADW